MAPTDQPKPESAPQFGAKTEISTAKNPDKTAVPESTTAGPAKLGEEVKKKLPEAKDQEVFKDELWNSLSIYVNVQLVQHTQLPDRLIAKHFF